MGRAICKFTDTEGKDYYLMWSTIVDAPVTYGMSKEEMLVWYKEEYGNHGIESLTEYDWKRVEENGTMYYGRVTLDEIISNNRAGKDETCLTKEQILEWYCIKQEDPPRGQERHYEDEEVADVARTTD